MGSRYNSPELPAKLNIQDNDLCSLLVNMLDNAIEACDKLPDGQEKKIDITVGLKNDFVYFNVSNLSVGTPAMESDEFVTSTWQRLQSAHGSSLNNKKRRPPEGDRRWNPTSYSFSLTMNSIIS